MLLLKPLFRVAIGGKNNYKKLLLLSIFCPEQNKFYLLLQPFSKNDRKSHEINLFCFFIRPS